MSIDKYRQGTLLRDSQKYVCLYCVVCMYIHTQRVYRRGYKNFKLRHEMCLHVATF